MNLRKLILRPSILLLSACLIIVSPPSTYANTVPTIVIADTAIDSDNPEFSKNIILELCILEWAACPNGQKFMQGKGSAKLPFDYLVNNGFNHGTQMVSAAVRTNPDLNIIFIRVIGNSSSGARLSAGATTVALVLQWISQNQALFNIQAAVIAQGHHNLSYLTNYCPRESMVEGILNKLLDQGVPVFFPAGNSGDKSRVDWPACYPSVMTIGALNPDQRIASYSNVDSNLIDYFELGTLKVNDANGFERTSTGSSIAAQIAAAKWMQIRSKNLDKTFAETKMIFDRNTHNVSISSTSSSKAINRYVYDPADFDTYLAELSKLRQAMEELKWLLQSVKLSKS